MLITGKLHSIRRYRSFKDTSFASTFVRERKVREGGKRVGREVGESIRTRVERGKDREERTRKSGIQWPVSSHGGTYVMSDVNVREREKNSRDRNGDFGRKREVRKRSNMEDPKPHELW